MESFGSGTSESVKAPLRDSGIWKSNASSRDFPAGTVKDPVGRAPSSIGVSPYSEPFAERAVILRESKLTVAGDFDKF